MGKKSEATVTWNQTAIKRLPAPPAGERVTYHHPDRAPLVVMVTSASKTFYLCRRVQGRQQRIRIGQFPAWTPTAAIERADEIEKAIDRGENPHQEKRDRSAAPTLADFWKDTFDPQHVARLKPTTAYQYRLTWRLHISETFGELKLADITKAAVRTLHASIGATGRERTANFAVVVLRCMLNHAIEADLFNGSNPTAGVRMFRETPRNRYLTREEIARLYQALDADAQETGDWTLHDVVKLALLTGARRGNVLSMAWKDLDLDGGRWLIPASETKTSRAYLVTLAPGAVAILRQRKQASESPSVFPAVRRGKHGRTSLEGVKRGWERVTERAGLHGVRLHDLRHTAASLLANNGASLQLIGAQLGHANTRTTERYSHLLADTVAAAVAAATADLGKIAGGE